ncbi:MAG: hypothetical protein JST55_14700 [Bacteroidetes bacterium]|nr:hypothetical protein [Bacteroidota bacterium]
MRISKLFIFVLFFSTVNVRAQYTDCIDYSDIRQTMIYNNVLKDFIDKDEAVLKKQNINEVICSYKDGRMISETVYNEGGIMSLLKYNFRGEAETKITIERDSLKRVLSITVANILNKGLPLYYVFDYDSDYITKIKVFLREKLIEQGEFVSMPPEAYEKNSNIILADKYNFVDIKDMVNSNSIENLYCEYFVNEKGRITLVKDVRTGAVLDSVVYKQDTIKIIQPKKSSTEYRLENGRITYKLQRTKDNRPMPPGSKGLRPDKIQKMKFYIEENGLIESARDEHDEINYTYRRTQ